MEDFARRWDLAQRRYKGTIRTFARNSVRQIPTYEIEDIEQELMVVLWRCVENYDPNRGASFNTLFQGSARNKIISLIRKFETKSRKGYTTSIDEESVRAAVDRIMQGADASEHAFARIELQKTIDIYGPGVLSGKRIKDGERPAA